MQIDYATSSKTSAQSHHASLLEVVSSTAFGFTIAAATNYFVLPQWGFAASLTDSLELALVFTTISILRGYLFRRAFEHLRTTGVLP